VDRWRGTEPWFLLAGLILGVVVGFYELIKATNRK
jgi:F0F1-type ATP synthase assembly protein I